MESIKSFLATFYRSVCENLGVVFYPRTESFIVDKDYPEESQPSPSSSLSVSSNPSSLRSEIEESIEEEFEIVSRASSDFTRKRDSHH
jgi:hypothetical protein